MRSPGTRWEACRLLPYQTPHLGQPQVGRFHYLTVHDFNRARPAIKSTGLTRAGDEFKNESTNGGPATNSFIRCLIR
jgi:hypothetical protein